MLTRTILTLAAALVLAAGCGEAQQRTDLKQCPTSPEGVRPLLVGSTVPAGALFTPEGKQVLLRDVVARKPTVLVVYRGNWCVYCQKQLEDLKTIEPELLKAGYQIVAISPDSPQVLKDAAAGRGLNYQLLSDPQLDVISGLGLAYTADDRAGADLARFGVKPVDLAGQPQYMLPVPAVFITNQAGLVQFEYVNPDYTKRVDPALVLAAAKCLVGKP